MNVELFEYLLSQPESKILDFKKETYDFSGNKVSEDANFVKDILSFANTIRDETAYIIAGVSIEKGKKVLHGIKGMMDDASLQQKIKDKIQPHAEFTSYDFLYKNKVFGVIEIPVHPYEIFLSPKNRIGDCDPNKVYHRLSSSNNEASLEEKIAIERWLAKLREETSPPPKKQVFQKVENYIVRTVTPADSEPLVQFMLEHERLEKVLEKEKRIALLAWGLNGKTTELKRLAFTLSQKEDLYVFLILMNNHIDQPISSHIPKIDKINQSKLVLLIDGLDEVLPSKFKTAIRHISQFVNDYPEAKVVVSCRTNFYITDKEDNGLSTLINFKTYKLDKLSNNEIEKYLDETYPHDKTTFLDEVLKKGLYDLLVIPYYLIKLSKLFNETHQIFDSKAKIFKNDICGLIGKEIAKIEPLNREILEKKLFELLKKLAFIMVAKGSNTISNLDLEDIFRIKSDFELVTSAGTIFYGTDSKLKIWRFNHNNTQEYLAAQVLADLPFNKIKKIIGNGSGLKRIKPSWVNTLSFLNSILPPNSNLKKKISDWMVEDNLELVITIEPENFTDDLRLKIFKQIFNIFKQKKRYINRSIFKLEDIANFSECPEVFDFLLKELCKTDNIPSIYNALSIINFCRLGRYDGYKESFKPLYKQFLFGNNPELDYIALAGYVSLFDLTKEEFEVVFEKFHNSENSWIRFQFFNGIWLTNNQDKLVSYIIEQARYYIREGHLTRSRNSHKMRLTNEIEELSNCLIRITKVEALVILFTELKVDLINFYNSLNFDKILETALKNSSKYSNNFELNAAIDKLFLFNLNSIIHYYYRYAYFVEYYTMTNRSNQLLNFIYCSKSLEDYSVSNIIGKIADKHFIDFLFKESENNKITNGMISQLARYIEQNENRNELYFREVFNLGNKPEIVSRDYEGEALFMQKRNLEALFNKSIFIEEVKKIFKAFGKDTLTREDYYSNTEPNFWSLEFCDVARDFLDLNHNNTNVELTNTLNKIELSFDSEFIYRVYDYLLIRNELNLNDFQQKTIIEWCDIQVKNVHFSESLTQNSPSDWSYVINAQLLSFFIRRLKLSDYDPDLYLDMLSFIKNGDTLIGIVDFVDMTIGFEKTKKQSFS